MPELPAFELFTAVLARTIELMTLGRPMSLFGEWDERDAISEALMTLPLTCKSFTTLTALDARWAWIVTYERIRLYRPRPHLFEYMPSTIRSLDLASPMAPTPLDKLKTGMDMAEQRDKFVLKAEKCFDSSVMRVVNVVALPPALPYRVAVVAQGIFKHFRSVQHHHPEWIQTCAHRCCGRTAINPDEIVDYGPDTEIILAQDFWREAGFNLDDLLAEERCWCSSQCRRQYVEDVMFVTCVDAFNDLPDNYARNARSSASARGCPLTHMLKSLLARNAAVQSRMRAMESKRHVAITREERVELQARVIKALNVETAVVIAAIAFKELPKSTRRDRMIGPRFSEWRQMEIAFKRPLTQIRGIYEERASAREPLLTAPTSSARWVQTVKSRLLYIF